MTKKENSEGGILFIVSGPAGTGKTTLCERMLAEASSVQRIVTATTRAPREGERDGVDYHFFDLLEFEAKIAESAFYEHARVHSNRYGVLKSEVQGKLNAGIDLLLNVDVQGAETFRQAAKTDALLTDHLVTIFIMPPNLQELENRLRGRDSDDEAEIQRRLRVATDEMKQATRYDYCLHSASRDADFEQLRTIYRAEKMRIR